jgi:transposase
MLSESLSRGILLPELKFIKDVISNKKRHVYCEKESKYEVCPKCATKSSTVYDHVFVTIRDAPIRIQHVILKIKKRLFLCKACKKPFREPIQGIVKGFRTTQRLRNHILWAAENYSDLKRVAKYTNSSSWLVYKFFYEQVDLELRKYKSPWPKTVGIDEHSFLRSAKKHKTDFVTVFIDYSNKRMKEVVLGKAIDDLSNSHIKNIKGREIVKNVVLDLSPTFRSFC